MAAVFQPHSMMPADEMILVGASAGGVEALFELAANLPADMLASVCIALHVSRDFPSHLPDILSRAGLLPASHSEDGEALVAGRMSFRPGRRASPRNADFGSPVCRGRYVLPLPRSKPAGT